MKTIELPAILVACLLDALPLDRQPQYLREILLTIHHEFVHQIGSNRNKGK